MFYRVLKRYTDSFYNYFSLDLSTISIGSGRALGSLMAQAVVLSWFV